MVFCKQLTSCCVFEYFRIPFSSRKYRWQKKKYSNCSQGLESKQSLRHTGCLPTLEDDGWQGWAGPYLVPAFQRILPPLHQVALADTWDTEVSGGAGHWAHVQTLQVVQHFPVTRLEGQTIAGSWQWIEQHIATGYMLSMLRNPWGRLPVWCV